MPSLLSTVQYTWVRNVQISRRGVVLSAVRRACIYIHVGINVYAWSGYKHILLYKTRGVAWKSICRRRAFLSPRALVTQLQAPRALVMYTCILYIYILVYIHLEKISTCRLYALRYICMCAIYYRYLLQVPIEYYIRTGGIQSHILCTMWNINHTYIIYILAAADLVVGFKSTHTGSRSYFSPKSFFT